MNVRTKGALITLNVGLILNIALGASKLAVGLMSDSASIVSDAVNNLSDAAVSAISIIAVALSSRAADHEHPYGHGRYEYIATFILGAVIAVVGIELLRDGIARAIHPAAVDVGTAVWITLAASIAVKAFMAVFYAVRGGKAKNGAIKAAAVDSASDAAVTAIVLACMLVEKGTGAHIDGYASIGVSVIIIVFAMRILRRIISRLLGERPDAELIEKVHEIISQSKVAVSSHDLIINDYGETHKIAEIDVVFPSDMSFLDVHKECDALERRVKSETGVKLSIHADPLMTDDARLVMLSDRLTAALSAFGATVHDVAIDDAQEKVKLDVMLPDDAAPSAEILDMIRAEVRAELSYTVETNVDYM